jgi:hypothetical protein
LASGAVVGIVVGINTMLSAPMPTHAQ